MLDYRKYDAFDLSSMIRRGDVTARELLDRAIKIADDTKDTVNAVCMRFDEQAYENVDRGMPEANGTTPYYGVPFLLKNLSCYMKGTVTDHCSKKFANDEVAASDSFVTRRYKQLGFNIFGKTTCPEFGLAAITESQLYGVTKNPLNLDYSVGGSSGGACAAVAAGIVPVAHATDGLGSLRTPSSLCGLVGLKPTRGSVSQGHTRTEGWGGLIEWNVVSRSVRDSENIFNLTNDYIDGDSYTAPRKKYNPRKLKVAYNFTPPAGHHHVQETEDAVNHAILLLKSMGHECHYKPFEYDHQEFSKHVSVIVSTRIASNIKLDEGDMFDLENYTRYVARRGREYLSTDYIEAMDYVHSMSRKMAEFMQDYDIYLNPTTGQLPWKNTDISLKTDNTAEIWSDTILHKTPFTPLANVTGQPSLTVPIYWTDNNLPIGILLNGRWGEEELLFDVAKKFELEDPWIGRYNYE